MSLIGNILWFVFGGLFMGLGWYLSGILLAITIIGLPWTASAFRIGTFSFVPFGRTIVRRGDVQDLRGEERDLGSGPAGLLGNIIWFVLGGWWLGLSHLMWAIGWCITIIGIPFGVQHFKLAAISLAPVGTMVVSNQEADYVRSEAGKRGLGL